VPGYEYTSWNGVFVPRGTPRPIIKSLHANHQKALAAPDVKQQFANQGLVPLGQRKPRGIRQLRPRGLRSHCQARQDRRHQPEVTRSLSDSGPTNSPGHFGTLDAGDLDELGNAIVVRADEVAEFLGACAAQRHQALVRELLFQSGAASAFWMVACRLFMIGRGVPLGTKTPFQLVYS